MFYTIDMVVEDYISFFINNRCRSLTTRNNRTHSPFAVLSKRRILLPKVRPRFDNLPWNLGERVTVGSPVAVLLAGDAPYARVYVPEPYRVKIREGDRLKVRVDGLAEAVVGTVRWISSDPAFTPYYALNQEERARLMYLAQVQLPKSQSHLPDGVPAQVQMP